MSPIWRGLTRNRAETDPTSPDHRLRGRTYAISFDRVWNAALSLADGGLGRWHVQHADDQEGVIRAVSRSLLFRSTDDVEIAVRLDENAQTRVDVRSQSRKDRGDLGRNPRTIGRFFRALDRSLGATPSQILDPTASPTWTHPA